ncbi:glycosyltransferase 61 family protein [Actinopolymorpha sp. B11F2]|uniref:glycosyltransferase family 61 protein n=1 Tax=Actinopolymorpha sp. B11F2 TaxID=3160862 RepID=UPI0032E441D2
MISSDLPVHAHDVGVDTEPNVLGYGGLNQGCFGAEVRRFRVVGVRGVDAPTPPDVARVLGDTEVGWRGANTVSVPELWPDEEPVQPDLWCLENAHVFGGRIHDRGNGFHYDGQLLMTATGGLLPSSRGVMDGNRTLAGDILTGVGAGWTVTTPTTAPTRRLTGTHVLLGNVHHHFGHTILEGLTRTWAVPYLSAELRRSVRFLVYEPEIRAFSRRLLARAGIPPDRLGHASRWDVVERLIVPDCAMRTHWWITSAQADVWRTVAIQASPGTARIFLSRAGVKYRQAVNNDQVEALFHQAGWEVVRPEQLSVDDQVRLAARARSMAGCVGSQMYLSCFQPPGGSTIVIAPRNFFLRDDVLVAAAVGHDLHVGFGDMVDFAKPREERTWKVDLDVVKELLTQVR